MELEKRIEELEKKVAALEVQAQEQLVKNQTVTIIMINTKDPAEIQSDLKKILLQLGNTL